MFIAVVVVVFEKTVSVMLYFMPSIANGNIIVSTLVLRPENDSGQPGNNWVGRFAFSLYSIRVETQQILDRLVVELFSGRTVQIASFDSVGLQWSWAGHESTMIPSDFIVSTMLCVWCRKGRRGGYGTFPFWFWETSYGHRLLFWLVVVGGHSEREIKVCVTRCQGCVHTHWLGSKSIERSLISF